MFIGCMQTQYHLYMGLEHLQSLVYKGLSWNQCAVDME